jgi:hypothetical protein
VPWLATARGAEAGRAALRLAGIPVDLAGWGLRQLTGRLGPAVSWLPTGRVEKQEAASGMPVLLVRGLADRASVFTLLRRAARLRRGPGHRGRLQRTHPVRPHHRRGRPHPGRALEGRT